MILVLLINLIAGLLGSVVTVLTAFWNALGVPIDAVGIGASTGVGTGLGYVTMWIGVFMQFDQIFPVHEYLLIWALTWGIVLFTVKLGLGKQVIDWINHSG